MTHAIAYMAFCILSLFSIEMLSCNYANQWIRIKNDALIFRMNSARDSTAKRITCDFHTYIIMIKSFRNLDVTKKFGYDDLVYRHHCIILLVLTSD
jgi:hypothetical protein